MKLKTIAFIAILTAISLTSCQNSPATENSVAESSVEEKSIIAETIKPEESSTVSETSIQEISEDDFFHADTGQSTTSSQIVEDESSLIMEIAEYEYIDDEYNKGIEITKYNGTDTNVNIPKQIDGMNVTAIGESAFEGNESIVSVTIPNTVIDIKTNAFAKCKNLISATFEENSKIDGIFTGAFEETGLTEFTVPENCRYVSEAFDMSYDVKKFVILGEKTSVLNLHIPSMDTVVYFPKGSQAETDIVLHHSPTAWKYLDELE